MRSMEEFALTFFSLVSIMIGLSYLALVVASVTTLVKERMVWKT